ncbi:MAG: GNAT family N-acetyltransferase [Candidatus Thiodiazotropha sp. (ex Lucinoma borealis)]|nr:GNAT family N-acetyltransferase [Candidatus Thiodiazotropha sp. (ex Lucinoma borealis)]
MNFDYKLEKIQTNALSMEFFLVPWDTEIMEKPVAEIRCLNVKIPKQARNEFQTFFDWCNDHKIALINCRISHDQLVESMFLQAHEFRFIELNYRPQIKNLQNLKILDDEIDIVLAEPDDRLPLAGMAGSVFQHGRFHQDPRLGVGLGNYRYKSWLLNAFELSHQKVYKFMLDQKIIAFFVIEYPEQGHAFWSLTGLAPGMQGKGLGKRVWRRMMLKHQQEGIDTISSSISSHNITVLNLYLSLVFRFPTPSATFHWRSTDTQQ